MATEEIQAGDLMYASSQLEELAAKVGVGSEEGKSLAITAAWLDRQVGTFGEPAAITAIPPVR